MDRLRIDPEFRDLCPVATEDETDLLRESVIAEGCRDPIIVWKGHQSTIVDGHRRYAICTEESIPYKVHNIAFADRSEVRRFILRTQLARRNLTDAQRSLLRGRLYNELKGPQGGTHDAAITSEANGQNVRLVSLPGRGGGAVAQEIAERDGVTERTIRRDGEFAEAADAVIEKAPELKAPIERGVIPKNAVAALAEAPPSTLHKLSGKEGLELCKAAITAAKKQRAKRASRDGKPPRQATSADTAKNQIQLWAECISRWLSQSPSIDELRSQWPGAQGNAVLHHAKALYESLVAWKKAIK